MNSNRIFLRLSRLKSIHKASIILNPTENTPIGWREMAEFSFLSGLYVADKQRDDIDQFDPKIIFGGRRAYISDVIQIQDTWAKLLRAESVSLRPLSGLHAYTAVFMGAGRVGDAILILPEEAGGHFSVKEILSRLGFRVLEMPISEGRLEVDIPATNRLIREERPRFLLVDRSEGLNYEDFSSLATEEVELAFFDASQYLTNILAGDYENPFSFGFDAILATMHKNFPGPQKALVAFRKKSPMTNRIIDQMRIYISNTHVFNIYLAAVAISSISDLKHYSKTMLATASELRKQMLIRGLAVVPPISGRPFTQHIWIRFDGRRAAYNAYRSLESIRILTNYRKLPYGLGYGLRLGTAWSCIQGMRLEHVPPLADLVHAAISQSGSPLRLRHKVRELRSTFR